EGKWTPWETTPARWAAACARYGVTPGATPPAEAARRIADSTVRERLLSALDVWLGRTPRDRALTALLAAADPDEFRGEARAAGYQRALLARAFRGRPLPGPQPVWFALGQSVDVTVGPDLRGQLLVAAHREHP